MRSDKAVKTWVNFQVLMTVIGFILALIFLFGFFLPRWNQFPGPGF